MSEQKPVFVTADWGISGNKRTNLHITVGLLSFSTMLFHFATVFFFTLQLKSIALVGIFLWLWNLFAFLFDIPIGILQYYIRAKTLFIFGVISQIIALGIFATFIFSVTDFISANIAENAGVLESIIRFFLFDGMNMLLLLCAAVCYGFTKEINDITTISYVLSNATPDQYKSIIAKNNLFYGIGSFLWLLTAWFILTFSPKLIVFGIIFMILVIFFIMYYFFDNSETTLHIRDIKKFQVYFTKNFLEDTKKEITKTVSNIDIKAVLRWVKYVYIKPIKVSENMISASELVQKTKENMADIYATLQFSLDKHIVVYWSCIMLLTFGFWDTFASTFLIEFLDQLKSGWSFILLGLIAIPAFGLQGFFGKLSDKIGVYQISIVGLILSGSSLLIMSFFTSSLNFTVVMFLALINSIGYSICMSLAVATFLESYNVSHADRKNLKEIDANASAAPMKILQNLANVIWLFLWGLILSLAGYGWFFFTFGLFILGFFGWSLMNKKHLQ